MTHAMQALSIRKIGIAAALILSVFSCVSVFAVTQEPSRSSQTANDMSQIRMNDTGMKPFLSPVVEPFSDGFATYKMEVPAKGTIEPAVVFWDVPFAFNVPFEIPYQGEPVSVYFDLHIVWEDPKPDAKNEDMTGFFERVTHGIYRMDQAPLPEGSVRWDTGGRSPRDKEQLWQNSAGGIPVYVNAEPPPPANLKFPDDSYKPDNRDHLIKLAGEEPNFQRKAFRRAHDDYLDDPLPLVLEPATPGWYVFWVAINTRRIGSWDWPKGMGERDQVKVRFRLHYVVYRGFSSDNGKGVRLDRHVIQYLFKQGPRPKKMPDESQFKVGTIEFPVTIRRDSWVFDHIENRTKEGDGLLRLTLQDKDWPSEVESAVNIHAQGVKLRLRHKAYKRETHDDGAVSLSPMYEDSGEWDFTFPKEIKDMGLADVVLTGKATRRVEKAYQSSSYATEDPFLAYSFDVSRASADELTLRANNLEQVAGAGVHREKNYYDYIKPWVGDYWLKSPDFLSKTDELIRYRFFSKESLKIYPARKMLFEDTGPHAIFQYYCGPWHGEVFYCRKKDIEAQRPAGAVSPSPTQVEELKPLFQEDVPLPDCAPKPVTTEMVDLYINFLAGLLDAGVNTAVAPTHPNLVGYGRLEPQNRFDYGGAASLGKFVWDQAQSLMSAQIDYQIIQLTEVQKNRLRAFGHWVDYLDRRAQRPCDHARVLADALAAGRGAGGLLQFFLPVL